MEVVVTTEAIRCAKPQSNCHYQQTNIQLSYRPDDLPVAQQCQSIVQCPQIQLKTTAKHKVIKKTPVRNNKHQQIHTVCRKQLIFTCRGGSLGKVRDATVLRMVDFLPPDDFNCLQHSPAFRKLLFYMDSFAPGHDETRSQHNLHDVNVTGALV